MAVPSVLQDEGGHVLEVVAFGKHHHLVTEDHARVATHWKSVTHTTAATSTVAKALKGGALVMTDILVSGERINGGTVTVRFSDGVNLENITVSHVTDAPVNIATSLQGRCLGWKDAFIEVITSVSNQDATVTVWFYHVKGEGVETFADWDSNRDAELF